jgi:hypothetical protein
LLSAFFASHQRSAFFAIFCKSLHRVQKPLLCINPRHALSPALFAYPSLLHKNDPKNGKAGEGEFDFFWWRRFFLVGVVVARSVWKQGWIALCPCAR